MKRAAAFWVCSPDVLGWVRIFFRAVVTEIGKNREGSGEKVIFVEKK